MIWLDTPKLWSETKNMKSMSHATALSSKICVSKSMMYSYLYSDELAMVMEALVPTLQLSYLRLLQKILHDHCLPSLLRITQMAIFNNDDFATTINHPFLFHSTLPSQMENYFQILSLILFTHPVYRSLRQLLHDGKNSSKWQWCSLLCQYLL